MQNDLAKARLVSRALENSGYYTCLSNIHRPKPQSAGGAIASAATQIAKGHAAFGEEDAEFYYEGLPVVSFRFTDEFKAKYPHVKQAWMQTQLRTIGWIVPK
jgi:glutamate decarboxylase